MSRNYIIISTDPEERKLLCTVFLTPTVASSWSIKSELLIKTRLPKSNRTKILLQPDKMIEKTNLIKLINRKVIANISDSV